VYFPETKIIHYKGESTKKGSLNYVFVFYNAMVIFAKKHFSARYARIFSIAIHTAIYLRAAASIAKRLVLRLFWPSIDALISFVFLQFLGKQWEAKQIQFPDWAYDWLIPSYILTWLFCAWLFGLYDKGTRSAHIWKSTFLGTVAILVAYALFPKEWQFSRLFILLGASGFLISFYLTRAVFALLTKGRLDLGKLPKKRFGIVANVAEFERIETLLKATYPEIDLLLPIDADKLALNNQIDDIIRVHQLNELIFSAQDVGASRIIQLMADTSAQDLEYKIAQPNTSYLIGSSSIDQAGAYYNLHFDALQLPANKRLKRIFDLMLSMLLLILSPLTIWMYENKRRFLVNLFRILVGRYSFVGVGQRQNQLKKGKSFLLRPRFNNDQAFEIQEFIYTKSYQLQLDFKSVWNQLKALDNQAH
jgi:hypothetical protein